MSDIKAVGSRNNENIVFNLLSIKQDSRSNWSALLTFVQWICNQRARSIAYPLLIYGRINKHVKQLGSI